MKNHITLFVSPVPRIATQGRDRQVFTVIDPKTRELKTTKSMNKTRETGTSVTLKFPLDVYSGRYVTGLDELVPNPIYQMDPENVFSTYNLSPKWLEIIDKVVKQSQISRQTYFEILDNVDPDYYTSLAKNGTMLNFQPSQLLSKDREPSFIERFSVEFFDRPNRFVDDTPRQRMAIQLCKVHNKIAKSKNESNPVEHWFYISEENEAEMEKMRKQDIIDLSIAEKVKLFTESSEFMAYKVGSLLTTRQDHPIVKGNTTKDGVKQAINNYLNDRTYQMENIDKFNGITELLKSPEGRLKFEVKYLVQQGLNTRVLDNRDGYLIWNSRSAEKNIYKWTDYEKFISFLVSEMLVFDPQVENPVTNWYNELYKEVKAKNVWIE
jgi:hypothetical protein